MPRRGEGPPRSRRLLQPVLGEHVVVVGPEGRLAVPDQQDQPHQAPAALSPEISGGSGSRGSRTAGPNTAYASLVVWPWK